MTGFARRGFAVSLVIALALLLPESSRGDVKAWKGTITNRTARAITLTVVLTLYDDEGFVLESDYKYGVVIGAGASETISGQSQMKLSVFNRVVKYGVSVQ